MRSRNEAGFTLVELAVSLIVIGLIIAGVTAGKSLMDAAYLRSVIADINRIKGAVETFQDKYGGLPGDLSNAASLWASSANGNGNGSIASDATASSNPESLRAWQQLGLSELWPGSFTGTSAAASPYIITTGSDQNVPTSRVKNGFYYLWSAPSSATAIFGITQGNMIHIGSVASTDSSFMGPLFSVSEAYDIDKKLDDGVANSGTVFGVNSVDTSGGTDCSRDASHAGGDYNYTSTTVACRLIVWLDEKR